MPQDLTRSNAHPLGEAASAGRRACLCAVAALLGALAFAGPARAAEEWDDSETVFSLITDCVTGDVVPGVGTYVSLLRDRAALPSTGTVFYARTVAGVLACSSGGHAVRFEVTPPRGTSLAITPSTPVRCFTRDIPTGVTTAMPAASCPQTTSAPIYGGAAAFDPAGGGTDPTWDIPRSTAIEIQFPLVAGNPLMGNLTTPCDCLRAFTKVIDTFDNPVLKPFIEVVVGAASGLAAVVPPPVAPPGAPPGAPSSADTSAPAATLSAGASQKLARTVAVSISCSDEPCRATAGGTVHVPKVGKVKAKTYKLPALTKQIAKGAKSTARLKLNATPRAAIKRALKAGKRIRVKLSVRIADGAGNTRTLTREVRLKL